MRIHREVSVRRACDESPCRLEHEYYCMNARCAELIVADEKTWGVEQSGKVCPTVNWPYHSKECAGDNRWLFWKERELVNAS